MTRIDAVPILLERGRLDRTGEDRHWRATFGNGTLALAARLARDRELDGRPRDGGRSSAAVRRKRRSSRLGWLLRVVFGAAAVCVVLSVLLVAALRYVPPITSAVMILEPGPLRAIRYEWVGRDRIAIEIARAVIAAEDQKFLTHNGFDVDSIQQALDDYRRGEGLRGASTITQQVAKNLFLWNGRSFVRKALEAYFALLLESLLPKERILELYLNIAEFGPNVFGVQAAARELLGTDASRLTAAEAALLAAVLPSPKRYSAVEPGPYVRGRQAQILAQMALLDARGHYRGLVW